MKDSARENFERKYGRIKEKVIENSAVGYGEGKKPFTDEGLLDEIQECVGSDDNSHSQ